MKSKGFGFIAEEGKPKKGIFRTRKPDLSTKFVKVEWSLEFETCRSKKGMKRKNVRVTVKITQLFNFLKFFKKPHKNDGLIYFS